MTPDPLIIMLAEDDEGHALLVSKNLKRAGIHNDIVHTRDGQEALDFINCAGKYVNRRPNGPLLLLLDINMPRLDGLEVLSQIKQVPRTSTIPVIMLTTTDDPREIQRCYELGCNIYITKPVAYESFVEAVRRLGLLLQIVKVPREENLPPPGCCGPPT